ncbi:hypothetical protein COOONC_15882 [Cooperia oncophora]
MYRGASHSQEFLWRNATTARLVKSSPPSTEKRERSEPKVSVMDDTDGTCTKIEYTETVDESSMVDLIENDREECEHISQKLPPAKRKWEHVKDVRMQASSNSMSSGIAQKGAIVRMGEHLYGFEGIRDLSLNAAADVDRFFGRKMNSDLFDGGDDGRLPPFPHDYTTDYSRRFSKSSLTRSAYDISDCQREHSSSATVAASVSHEELYPRKEAVLPGKDAHVGYDPYGEEANHAQYMSSDTRTFIQSEDHSRNREAVHLNGLSQTVSSSMHIVHDRLHNTLTQSVGSDPQLYHRPRTDSWDSSGIPKFQASAPFECHHHLVRDFEDPSPKGSTSLVCDADVQMIAPRLQSEGSIRSMTSSRQSVVDQLSEDHELANSAGLRTPVSSYSEEPDFRYDPYQSETNRFISENLGTQTVRRSRESLADSTTSDRQYGGGKDTMTITKTIFIDDGKESSDVSDTETLRQQDSIDSRSESDATIVPIEVRLFYGECSYYDYKQGF